MTTDTRTQLITGLAILATFGLPWISSGESSKDEHLLKLGGTWLYVEDITEGRVVEKQGPPMSPRFALRVEKDAVVWPRPRGDERITIDGTVIEKKNENGSIRRFWGEWKDGALNYTIETIRLSDNARVLMIHREFRVTEDGLKLRVNTNDTYKSVALYRHPDDISLPEPAKATIADMDWLTGAWEGKTSTSLMEERWSPPKGGAMLGVSRTVKSDKMVGFEYLRIVERDGGLVYVAQPGGRPPTEFVLTELRNQRAVFVNPRHDYPQRIIYEQTREGVMSASIGFAKGGAPRGVDYHRER